MNNEVPDRVTNKDLYQFMMEASDARHQMEKHIVGEINTLRKEFNEHKVITERRVTKAESDIDNLKKRDYPAYIGAVIAAILGALGIANK